MRINEFEFQDKNGNEIEPTKNQLVIYIKSLHQNIKNLKEENKQLKEELQKLLEIGNKMYGMLLKEHLYNNENINDAKTASQLLEQEKEHLKFMSAMFSFKELLEEKGEKHSNSQNQIAIRELEKLKDDLLENFGQASPWVNRVDLIKKINKQIESLKGE